MVLAKYLQIKHGHLGRGWVRGDCLNLVILFYKHELGIAIADCLDYKEDWAASGLNLILENIDNRNFSAVDFPERGDVVVFKIGDTASHCGVVLDTNEGTFLHTRKQGTCVENYITSLWSRRVYGFYRHCSKINKGNSQ